MLYRDAHAYYEIERSLSATDALILLSHPEGLLDLARSGRIGGGEAATAEFM
jgi:hypothetical protein